MIIVKFNDLDFIPSSHEDKNSPGVLKKILFSKDNITEGNIQMINWSKMPIGQSFNPHYHEDMDEIFIILSGKAKIKVGDEEEVLEKGDSILIPTKEIHVMENLSDFEIEYLAIGVTKGENGKTVVV